MTAVQTSTRHVLQVNGLGHAYGDNEVFRGLEFDVDHGQFVCIVGPSGVGKTTLLQCLGGLRRPTEGQIVLSGRKVDGPPADMAIVFQDYTRSLMPWLSVRGNVELPLRSAGLPKVERRERSIAALEEVGLQDALDQYPWQLSGGMQQRVAIARALAYRPSIILMDEPFASVDAQTRANLEDLVLKVRDHLGLTVLFVTHDIDEAVYLGDRILVLSGTPAGIAASLDVPLGSIRDQIATKSTEEFTRLRAEVYRLIMRAGSGSTIRTRDS